MDLGGGGASPAQAGRRVGSGLGSFATTAVATARVEFAQTLRASAFWVLQGVLLLTGLLVLIEDAAGAGHLRFASGQLRQFAAFQWLLLLMLAWPGLRRVAGSRGDLAFAAPVSSVAHASGALLGVLAWLVPATYAQFALRWVLGEAVGGQANWALLTTAPLLALASALLALGLAACVSLLLPRLMASVLVWLGVWVFLLQRSGGPFGGFAGPHLPLFGPLNVFFEGLLLSPSVGLGLMRPLVMAAALQMAAAGVVLLALWFCLLPLVDQRRSDPWRVTRYVGLVVAVGFAAWAVTGFRNEVHAQQPAQSPLVTQLDEWRVIASGVELEFEPASRQQPIRGTHLLEVAPAGGAWPTQLVLRVNPGMGVEASVDGAALRVERQGDSVVVGIADVVEAGRASLELALDFRGAPFWPYADHRFRQGGSFPALDSSQPITSLATGGVGYLLRDGDWLPWPWTSQPHVAAEGQRMTVTSLAGHSSETITFDGSVPKLVVVVPPPAREVRGQTAHVGRDAGAGLVRALSNIGQNLASSWAALGEAGARRLVAMPYLPDAYAGSGMVVIPEAYDLENAHTIGGTYRAANDPRVEERAALQVLARAWLNGQVLEPRGYVQARSFTRNLRRASTLRSGPAQDGNRWLQVVQIGPNVPNWSPTWEGVNPVAYDVTPFALWLGIELADDEVREADIALLRAVTGREGDYFDLSGRLLPWSLFRNRVQMGVLLGLFDWADEIGREEAVDMFQRTYRTVDDQSQEAVIVALEQASGVPISVPGVTAPDAPGAGVHMPSGSLEGSSE